MSNGFITNQWIDLSDDRNYRIINKYDTSELDKANAEERKKQQTSKSFRHVCCIPQFEFARDPLLKQYLFYCEAHEGEAARRVLRTFLALNP